MDMDCERNDAKVSRFKKLEVQFDIPEIWMTKGAVEISLISSGLLKFEKQLNTKLRFMGELRLSM